MRAHWIWLERHAVIASKTVLMILKKTVCDDHFVPDTHALSLEPGLRIQC
jgi:hypothetical protein